jgi:hypothetical protein
VFDRAAEPGDDAALGDDARSDATGDDGAATSDAPGPDADASLDAFGDALAVTITTPPAVYDLTAEGTLDWLYLGHLGSATPNHKATGGSQINAAGYGVPGSKGENNDPRWPVRASWTDGTPVATATDTGWYEYCVNGNCVYRLNTAAAATPRTLAVHGAVFDATATFTIALSDGSGVFVQTLDATGDAGTVDIPFRVTMTFHGSAGVELQASIRVGNISVSNGGMHIASAALH